MTTQKQAAANRANAKKSTGAKTPEGKAVVSGNAVKHGILSTRILLAGESADLFGQLRAELAKALKPVGMLEVLLSEKIAAAIWKQRRLIEAEAATIELGRDMRLKHNRQAIDKAMGGWGDASEITDDHLADITAEDQNQIQWLNAVLSEFESNEVKNLLTDRDLARLSKAAPAIYGQLKDEAGAVEEELSTYVDEMEQGLITWGYELRAWCEKEMEKYERRPMVQAVANMVRSKLSAPVELETLARYQVALDGELYRAMDQLRKQQIRHLALSHVGI